MCTYKKLMTCKKIISFFGANTTDILCYKAKEGGKLMYRKCSFIKDDNTQFVAVALNDAYKDEILTTDDVIILGKVAENIKTFN